MAVFIGSDINPFSFVNSTVIFGLIVLRSRLSIRLICMSFLNAEDSSGSLYRNFSTKLFELRDMAQELVLLTDVERIRNSIPSTPR